MTNFEEKMADVRERVKVERPDIASGEARLCPFSGCQKPCNPSCMLYRPDKKGYECYFQELQSIAWYLNKKMKK